MKYWPSSRWEDLILWSSSGQDQGYLIGWYPVSPRLAEKLYLETPSHHHLVALVHSSVGASWPYSGLLVVRGLHYDSVGPHCLAVDFLLSENFIMSRLNDFSNQPSFTKHTVMLTSLQTFWGDRLTNLVKTIHLISAEQGWARCNKAEVKCVLTESLLSLRARTRATYQSANIYDAFIFSCNYEHLLWVPIIQALIYTSEQSSESSESSHSLHILSSGGKSGKPSRTAQHSIYFLSITAQDLTDHFKPMNRNSALPDEPRGARGPGEWDSVLSSPSDPAKYM